LENIIEQAFVLCREDTIALNHLPPELRPTMETAAKTLNHMSLRAMEQVLITENLRRHHGNRIKAARDLGINPSTLYRKIKAYRIEVPESDGRRQKV
jgi:DNA-binding NtrC family response regulator